MNNSLKKPRLVIATDSFLPRWDGVTRFLVEMIPYLSKSFELVVIAPRFGVVDHEGFELVQIPLRRGRYGDLRMARFAYKRIRRIVRDSDIVFTQTIGPIGTCAILAASKKKPLVSFIHSLEAELVPMAVKPTPLRTVIYSFMRRYTKFLYNKSQVLITPSEHVSELLSWQGVRSKKVVVRLGVDTDKFCAGDSVELRECLGIAPDDFVIGQHGRLAREKDLKTLARAFFRTQKKFKNVKLLIVADGLAEIKKLLENRPGVILAGSQSDVVAYLRVMDVYVLSSLTETTSLCTLEAMATGLPVICTPVGFVKDYIVEGENGLFFQPKNPFMLSQKIEWVIAHPTLARRMASRGRKTVEEHFSWDQTRKGILSVLVKFLD